MGDNITKSNLHPKNARILFVSQEMVPYLDETPIGLITRYLTQGIQEKGREIRTFIPKYGAINDRRHQLHEVIRLSGVNITIDDVDHPLLIKVASLQVARMQVYFIDNEDYFQRKYALTDKNGKQFEDNEERSIFFCRGVIETVKQLGWTPDIVHCHGWFTAMLPLYLKRSFRDNPLFANTKVVYSVYDEDFSSPLTGDFSRKAIYTGVQPEDVEGLKAPSFLNITKTAIDFSDAIIKGSATNKPEIEQYIEQSGKPVLSFKNIAEYIAAYDDFYDLLLNKH